MSDTRRRRTKVEVPVATGDELRDLMRRCQDELRELIAKGYGDERVRERLKTLREQARAYERHDAAMWTEVSAEKRVKRYTASQELRT